MKRVWIAIFFLIISVSVCTYEQFFLKDFKEKINDDINSVEEVIDTNQNATEKIDALNKDYEKFEKAIGILCDEKNAQDLKMCIIEFNSLENAEKKKALIQMRALVNAIYNNQKLNFSNII